MSISIKMSVPIYIERDDSCFHAYSPALPGLHIDGMSEHEALELAKTAVQAHLASYLKHGEAIPVGVEIDVKKPGFFSGLFNKKHQGGRHIAEIQLAA